MFDGARILMAPLDWGLGHAARCVPIIRSLLELGAVPVIGADKGPLTLLRAEFPQLEHVRIPGMEVRYGRGRSQAWAMTKQFPAMLRQVREEHKLFDHLRQRLRLDAVISDQRFGLCAADIPSVLITHQVFPFSPLAQGLGRCINRQHIDRFDRCWIPDRESAPGLSGELSHGGNMPRNARYIGPLSRFAELPAPADTEPHRVVAVISGPEPQRTIFKQLVLSQLASIEGRHLVVTGDPGSGEVHQENIRILGHLNAEALCKAMKNAELIVGRTGYTTLMDLDAIGRGALLVPTPGQPEQEYLGRLHTQKSFHTVQKQHRLDIASALANPPARFHTLQESSGLSPAMTDLARLISDRLNAIHPPE